MGGDPIYLSPKPNSKYHHKETSIIIKNKSAVIPLDWNNYKIVVKGTKTGNHQINLIFSEDTKTVILDPIHNFEPGEKVMVQVFEDANRKNPQLNFQFQISSNTHDLYVNSYARELDEFKDEVTGIPEFNKKTGFPMITVLTNENPAPGNIFFRNSASGSGNDRYYAIIDNDLSLLYGRPEKTVGSNFKLEKSGYLSYMKDVQGDPTQAAFYIVDSSYQRIDSIYCGNGYYPDFHEFFMTADHHYFMLAYDNQVIDMSAFVPGGDSLAIVTGAIIQELDAQKNVIFQWRTWDHFEITDAANAVDLTEHFVDYAHVNSIEIDLDGNVLISSRHMDEITKIDRNTGDIIWRFGGKKNEFTFLNDPQNGFSFQHDARRQTNDNLTLFDNGNHHSFQVSSVKEYQLDEVNKTADLVWRYIHPSYSYGRAMGNAQRLSNGNTFINWGWVANVPNITEVRPDSTIAYELSFDLLGDVTYRAFRFEWYEPDPTTGIELPANNIEIQYFPNPVVDYLTIQSNLSFGEPAVCFLTDVYGRQISNTTIKIDSGNRTNTLNLKNVNSGIYFLVFISKGKVTAQKVYKTY